MPKWVVNGNVFKKHHGNSKKYEGYYIVFHITALCVSHNNWSIHLTLRMQLQSFLICCEHCHSDNMKLVSQSRICRAVDAIIASARCDNRIERCDNRIRASMRLSHHLMRLSHRARCDFVKVCLNHLRSTSKSSRSTSNTSTNINPLDRSFVGRDPTQ